MRLRRVPLADLTIEDAASFRHVGLFHALCRVVTEAGLSFLVPAGEKGPTSTIAWDRALLLNLLFWEPGTSDVLTSRSIPADVVMHVAWHALGDRFVEPSVEGHLLVESIASAFDVYLVGRLLGHAPDSEFLASQVPRMTEVALEAGVDEPAFEALLEGLTREPERSFEELRRLLYEVSLALVEPMSPEAACARLEAFDQRPLAPLLHHFELPTWVLRARLEQRAPAAPDKPTGRVSAQELDRVLRAEPDALAWLEKRWVDGALAGEQR